MPDFLGLCQAVARESGTVAGVPSFSSVAGASGRIDKIVNWVRDAWVNIQTERTDWLFRTAEFSKPLVIGNGKYSAASLNLDLAAWLPDTGSRYTMSLYDPAIGVADEGVIPQQSFDYWRDHYGRGAQTSNRPVMWAIHPDGSLLLGPAPDKAYVLNGLYKRAAQRLVNDGDTPIIPEEFHNAIIGRALELMINSDEAYDVLVPKATVHAPVYASLVIAQTPQVTGW